MNKLSAGIVAFHRSSEEKITVLLVHPGGPYWKNKDDGAWSIPKGEYAEGEDAFIAAKREFKEEMGVDLPAGQSYQLKPVKIKSGKVITAWAVEVAHQVAFVNSNVFEMEWPPRTGKKQSFPEVDRAAWYTIDEAMMKINAGQVDLLKQLANIVGQ